MECPTNRNDCDEVRDMNSVFEALPRLTRIAAERPLEFWDRQRAAILSRVPAEPAPAGLAIPRLAWTFAIVILAAAILLLSSGPRATAPSHRTPFDPDRDWLIEAEYAVQTGGPQALEPAALLADEIGKYQTNSISRTPKEVHDEE